MTPLFQTNFLPDLIHVYLEPLEMMVAFSLGHIDPGLTAACAFEGTKVPASTIEMSAIHLCLIEKV